MKLKWNKVEIALVKTWNYFHKVEIESHGMVDQKGIGAEKTCGYEWICMAGHELDGKNHIQKTK